MSNTYLSWEELRSLIRDDKRLTEDRGLSEFLDQKLEEVEKILDGPNESFEEKVYLNLKRSIENKYFSFQNNAHLKKAS